MAVMKIDRALALLLLMCCLAGPGDAKTKPKKDMLSPSSLSQFLQRVKGEQVATTTSLGSLWPLEGGPLTDLATDYKARHLNDIVVVRIVEQTLAQASGAVTAQRAFTASSAITGLAGQVNTNVVNPLYSLNSNSNLKGTGTANSQSLLQTSVAGRVVAILPNGNMVIEAEHTVSFNQQAQTIILRGVIRPGDIASDNSVPSTAVSDLELELKGKGVVTDATRQPNLFMRLLMRLLNF
jgi:flagellar L-ring protein FlgH